MSIIYVNQNVSTPGNGESWQNATNDLVSAIGQAESGDEIWVARGTYTPGTMRDDSFLVSKGVAVYGGFAGGEESRGDRDWLNNPTILSGNVGSVGKSFHVVINQSSELARLDGLIVQDGDTTEAQDNQDGGGIYNQKDKKLVLENVIVQNNVASDDGGGIRNDGELTIINSTVADNQANGTALTTGGGGLLNTVGASTTILNSTFSNNKAQRGGAIRNDDALTLINVTISGNEGGGLLNTTTNPLSEGAFSSRATIVSSTLTQNKGTGIDNFGLLLLSNNIIAGNNNGSNDLSNFAFGTIDSSGNNIIGNRGSVTNEFLDSDLIGSVTDGYVDPILGALQNNGGFTQTHRPDNNSPAVDSGAASSRTDAFDLDGDQDIDEQIPVDQRGTGFARVVGESIDIGAVELASEELEQSPGVVEPAEPTESPEPTAPSRYLKLSLQALDPESADNILTVPVDVQGRINGFEVENESFFKDIFDRARDTVLALQIGDFRGLTLSRTIEIPGNTSSQLSTLLLSALGISESLDLGSTDLLIPSIIEQIKNSNSKIGFKLEGVESSLEDVVLLAELTEEGTPLGSRLQGRDQLELIDLRENEADTITATFEVYREAAFNNEVGFFEIEDVTGQVLDSEGNLIGIGDDGYILAAMQKRIDVNLKTENGQMSTYTAEISGGKLLSSFIVSNGSVETLLDGDVGNNPAVYFSHVGANSDRADHVRLLGDNTFGFEDIENGGDSDFNDIIVKASFV